MNWNRFLTVSRVTPPALHHSTRRITMRFTQRGRRVLIPLAFAGVAGLALTGCTGDIAAQDKEDVDCAPYEEYGTFENESVSIAGTIVDTEADLMTKTWQD